jgi:hypothetical protein
LWEDIDVSGEHVAPLPPILMAKGVIFVQDIGVHPWRQYTLSKRLYPPINLCRISVDLAAEFEGMNSK